jgi:hypothetical protein
MRESVVERYFVQQVTLAGGRAKKLIGSLGDPDRLVIWPTIGLFETRRAVIHFVELKTLTGRLRSWQDREHKRLRDMGCKVFVLWTKAQVDDYIQRLRFQ